METGLAHAHSGLRWVLLVLLVVSIIKAIQGRGGNVRFFDKTRKLALFTMITAHIQLLLGFALYFMRGRYEYLSGENMKIALNRFIGLEHMLGMLIAIILITIGYKRIKSASSDALKFKSMLRYYGIALIIILASIPWPFRFSQYGWF